MSPQFLQVNVLLVERTLFDPGGSHRGVSKSASSSVVPEGVGLRTMIVYSAKGLCIFIQTPDILNRLYKQDFFFSGQLASCLQDLCCHGRQEGDVVTESTTDHCKSTFSSLNL